MQGRPNWLSKLCYKSLLYFYRMDRSTTLPTELLLKIIMHTHDARTCNVLSAVNPKYQGTSPEDVDHFLRAVPRFQVVEYDAAIFLTITEVYKEQGPAVGDYVQPQSREEPLRSTSLSITDQQFARHLWLPPVLQTKNLRRAHALNTETGCKAFQQTMFGIT